MHAIDKLAVHLILFSGCPKTDCIQLIDLDCILIAKNALKRRRENYGSYQRKTRGTIDIKVFFELPLCWRDAMISALTHVSSFP